MKTLTPCLCGASLDSGGRCTDPDCFGHTSVVYVGPVAIEGPYRGNVRRYRASIPGAHELSGGYGSEPEAALGHFLLVNALSGRITVNVQPATPKSRARKSHKAGTTA